MILIMFATAMMLAMLVFTAVALHSEALRAQAPQKAQDSLPFGTIRNTR